MVDTEQLERRVAALEREIAELRKDHAHNGSGQNWIERMTGMFKDFPEFEEIVRLGQEYRKSQTYETHG